MTKLVGNFMALKLKCLVTVVVTQPIRSAGRQGNLNWSHNATEKYTGLVIIIPKCNKNKPRERERAGNGLQVFFLWRSFVSSHEEFILPDF